MNEAKKFIVSHPPFLHDGSSLIEKNSHIFYAALPALLHGIMRFGMPAVGVISLSISSAMIWELLMNRVSGRQVAIGDMSSFVIGLILAMLLPATAPWWLVLTGTFIAVIIGREIFGGIGSNPFNPVAVSIAILTISWGRFLDFDAAYLNYDFSFTALSPLAAVKHFGPEAAADFSLLGLLLGNQLGGIGSTFGIGLILGGIYLIIRGLIRWEISLSYLAGVFITAFIFYLTDPSRFAGPLFHLLAGYTLFAAFFLLTEDSSSPVNPIPMFIYGAGAGVLTVLIRNIGSYPDGVILSVLIFNALNPLIDKIRPKAIGKES